MEHKKPTQKITDLFGGRSGSAITTSRHEPDVATPSVSRGEPRQLDLFKHAPESSDESDSDTAEQKTKLPPELSQRTMDIMVSYVWNFWLMLVCLLMAQSV